MYSAQQVDPQTQSITHMPIGICIPISMPHLFAACGSLSLIVDTRTLAHAHTHTHTDTPTQVHLPSGVAGRNHNIRLSCLYLLLNLLVQPAPVKSKPPPSSASKERSPVLPLLKQRNNLLLHRVVWCGANVWPWSRVGDDITMVGIPRLRSGGSLQRLQEMHWLS